MRKFILLFFAIFFILFLTSCPNLLNKPPENPHNPIPENGAKNQPLNVELSWDCSDPNGDDLSYDIYIGYKSLNKIDSDNASSSYQLSDLEGHKLYKWKIVAKDDKGNSTEGPLWEFTTANSNPSLPYNPNPSDHATNVSVNPKLSWKCSDPEDDPLKYDVFFGTDTNPTIIATNITTNEYYPGKLNYETDYYWKILAKDNLGGEIEGDVWTFTTRPATKLILSVDTSPYKNLNIFIDGSVYLSPKTMHFDTNDSVEIGILSPQEKDTCNCVTDNDTKYTFKKWNDGITNATRTIIITSNSTFTALMNKKYRVETATYPEDIVDIDGTNWYEVNATQSFIAPDFTEFVFENWEINGVSAGTEKTIVVDIDAPKKIVAHYNHIPTINIPDQEVDEGKTIELNLDDYASDPDGDPLTYSLETGVGKITDATYTYKPGYDALGTHEVKIGVSDGRGGESQDSFQVMVNNVNRAPEEPYSPSPDNNATDVSVDNLTLSWECSDPDGDELTYDVYFGMNSTPTDKVSSSQCGTTLVRNNLNELTTYYWKVVVEDELGAKNEGLIWPFTTRLATRLDLTVTTSPDTGLDISIDRTDYVSPMTLPIRINTSVDFKVLTPQEKDASIYVEGNDTRYTFNKWNDDVKDAERIELINKDATYTALMVKKYKVETATNPEALVNIESAGWYGINAIQTFTAPEVTGYSFDHWEVNGSNAGTNKQLNLTIDSPKEVIAVYSNTYSLTVTTSPDTELEVQIEETNYSSPKTTSFEEGESVNIGVTSSQEKDKSGYVTGTDTRYAFNQWNDGNTNKTRTITINSDKTYTAEMDKEYKVETGTNPESLVAVRGARWYEVNATQTFTAPEVTDYNFEYWEINESKESTESTIEVTLDTPKKIVAHYNHIPTINIPDQEVDEGKTLQIDLDNYASDPDGDELEYSLVSGVGTIIDSTYTFSPDFDSSGTYNVQIEVWDSKGGKANDNLIITVNDINRPPLKPYNPYPANNATNVSLDLVLSWDCEDPDGDNLTYDVYFGALGDIEVFQTNLSSTSLKINSLDSSKTYFWQILSVDSNSSTTCGNTWNFSTKKLPTCKITSTIYPENVNSGTPFKVEIVATSTISEIKEVLVITETKTYKSTKTSDGSYFVYLCPPESNYDNIMNFYVEITDTSGFSLRKKYNVNVLGEQSIKRIYAAGAEEGMFIIDVADPNSPKLISKVETPGSVVDVSNNEEYVFIAERKEKIFIVDIVNEEKPKIVSELNIHNEYIKKIEVSDNLLVVLTNVSFSIFDLSTLNAPVELEKFNHGLTHPISICFNNNILALSDWSKGITIIRLNKNHKIAEKTIIGIDSPWHLNISNDILYVSQDNGRLSMIDISDLNNLQIISSIKVNGNCRGLYISEGYAYIGDMNIVNIKDPLNPELKSEIDLYSVYGRNEGHDPGIIVKNKTAFFGNDENGLEIFDVSDSSNPIKIGNYDHGSFARSCVIDGKFAFILEPKNLIVAEINNIKQIISNLDLGLSSYSAKNMVIENNIGFIAGGTKLIIVDLRDPYNPKIISRLHIQGIYDLDLKDQYLGVVTWTNGFYLVDVSDLKNPTILDSFVNDEYSSIQNFRDININKDNIVYITSSLNHVLLAIDISNPNNIVEIVSWEGSSEDYFNSSNRLKYKGGYIYLSGSCGFASIDISNLEEPKLLSRISQGIVNGDINIYDNYAFVIESLGDRLFVIDISDNSNITLSSQYKTPVSSDYFTMQHMDRHSYLDDNKLYIADWSNGLICYNIENINCPELIIDLDWLNFTKLSAQ